MTRAIKHCTITDCGRRLYSKGMCQTHWNRTRDGKELLAPVKDVTPKLCSLDGCEEAHKSRGYCRLHYRRYMDGGDLLAPLGRPERFCEVTGCERRHQAKGLCKFHWQRHRDGVALDLEERELYKPTYYHAHYLCRRDLGRACFQDCIDCGRQAQTWSYDHEDPDEQIDPDVGFAFSMDVNHYDPRCKSCHSIFDGRDS